MNVGRPFRGASAAEARLKACPTTQRALRHSDQVFFVSFVAWLWRLSWPGFRVFRRQAPRLEPKTKAQKLPDAPPFCERHAICWRCTRVQGREANALQRQRAAGTGIAELSCGGSAMLMFKRSQLYLALAFAGVAEIIMYAMAR